MQSENRVVEDDATTATATATATAVDVDVEQQTSAQQGHRIRLALECMAGESLASRLRQSSQVAPGSVDQLSAGPLDTDHSNTGNHAHADVDTVDDNCIAGKRDTGKDELNFTRVDDIRRALYALCTRQDTDLAAQLELLVRFDDLEGWRESGAKSCAAWMNDSLCIDRRTAWERLRVGGQLRLLPIIQRLFRNGRLSWSKVRLLTRIADLDNEQMLAHASLDASVSDVQRLCDDYRWPADEDESTDEGKARLQYERRRLSWRQLPDGNTHIQLVLLPEKAQNFLHSIEHCEDLLYSDALDSLGSTPADKQAHAPVNTNTNANTDADSNPGPDEPISATQRRADAVVLMAERSLAFRGDDLAPADRYQVVLNVDAASLVQPTVVHGASGQAGACSEGNTSSTNMSNANTNNASHPAVPVRKPRIEGVGSVTVATARQIACDCSLFTMLSEEGEPLSIGRKSRLWPAPMRRAILTRDRHCQFTGCDSHRFLQIHHIVHWADGGETCIQNGVALCQFHHQLIHSGEFTIERATVINPKTEGAVETENALTQGLFSPSKRRLLPSRCRFRVTRQQKSRQNHQQTSCQAFNTESVGTQAVHTYPVHTYPVHTQPVNECRDGDLQWVNNYCNPGTGDTVFSINAGSIYTDSIDQRIKSVHSSHTLHVDTHGHGSHFLPAHAVSGSAERHSTQLPP